MFCTMDMAAGALRHMQRTNKTGVIDAKCNDQMECYMELRRTGKSRVHAQEFIEAWNSRKRKCSKGLKIEASCYLVPTKNFPHGLPVDIQACELTEEEIRGVVADETLDASNTYLIDLCMPRSRLGKGVRKVTYFIGTRQK